MALKFSVSGLRGVVGKDLTPPVVLDYTRAFALWAGPGKFVIGRDPRPHGKAFYKLVAGTLLAMGRDVIHLDMVPTPTVLLHTRISEAAAGIVITASHNPQQWNALKMVKAGGLFPEAQELQEIKALTGSREGFAGHDGFGKETVIQDPLEPHIEAVKNWVGQAGETGLSAAVDAVNGAGSFALPRLLRELGARVQEVNCTGSGVFPHPPEPKKQHLEQLDALLAQGKAEIGLACDPDADRLLVGTSKRGLLSEEHTLPLVAWAVLSKTPGTVITNFSTSMMVEHVAKRFGSKVIRVPVGEAYFNRAMRQHNAVLAGEGGGGIIVPDINPTRDSLAAAGVILSLGREIDRILDWLPVMPMKKLRFPGEDPEQVAGAMARIEELVDRLWPGLHKDTSDGVYIRAEDWWIHARPSNTEPIIRVYAEGNCEKELDQVIQVIEA